VSELREMASTMLANGQAHGDYIRKCMSDLDRQYKDYTSRVDAYKLSLERTLGIKNREPKSDLAESHKVLHREQNEDKRKSARKRE